MKHCFSIQLMQARDSIRCVSLLQKLESHHLKNHHILHQNQAHRIIEATFSPPSWQSCPCAQVLPEVFNEKGTPKTNHQPPKHLYLVRKCCHPPIQKLYTWIYKRWGKSVQFTCDLKNFAASCSLSSGCPRLPIFSGDHRAWKCFLKVLKQAANLEKREGSNSNECPHHQRLSVVAHPGANHLLFEANHQ